jgi:predicted DNA-binding antitoxin AbrB/MazE fold protein
MKDQLKELKKRLKEAEKRAINAERTVKKLLKEVDFKEGSRGRPILPCAPVEGASDRA